MNMTSRLRWRICSAGFGATLMVGACSIIVRPPVITPEQLHPEWAASCRAIIDETRHRVITDAELAACVAIPAAGGNLEGMRAWERTLPPEPEPPRPTLVPLETSGPIFLQAGQPWRWRGVSAFGQLDRFARGEDVSGFLEDFQGFNVLRVWTYVPWHAKDGTFIGWNEPAPEVVLAFLERVARDGWYVEITLLTDDDTARIAYARHLVEVLAAARPPNVAIEIGNEPRTNGKAIDTRALQAVLDASGLLYSSGDYEDSRRAFGRYLTTHTARDDDWPRRAHDLLEWYAGGGPNDPSDPPHRVPIVADEPPKLPQDVTGDREADTLAYYGTVSLLGAGGTFHFEQGKYSALKIVQVDGVERVVPTDGRPTAEEKKFAALTLAGLNAFPVDAPRGAYRRPVERSLRTYVVGNYMVRVRPETKDAPEAGWIGLDDLGVLWRKE